MDRIRRLVALSGLVLLGSTLWASPAAADSYLVKPNAGRSYPDIAADINGVVTYTYNNATETGNFHVTNTPYLIAGGPSSAEEYAIVPTENGLRQQAINLNLDSAGRLIEGPSNTYTVYGSVTAEGVTYSGLLLSGTPTAFGYQDLGAVGVSGTDLFDLTVKITGGALESFFGSEAYIRLMPELNSTFNGSFSSNFTAEKATSNTRSYVDHQPFPVPEPGTLFVLALGGLGVLGRHRLRRLAR